MKHFSVEARTRRFDHGTKYGGHGGQSLVKSFPKMAKRNIPGFEGVAWKVLRPEDAVSQLEIDCPTLRCVNCQRDRKGQVQDLSGLYQLTEYLEKEATLKHRTMNRRCPRVVDTSYLLPAVGRLEDGEVSLLDEPCGDVEIIVSQIEGSRNLRRVPVNCRWCNPCSKKHWAKCCKAFSESNKAKRGLAIELLEACDLDELVRADVAEEAHNWRCLERCFSFPEGYVEAWDKPMNLGNAGSNHFAEDEATSEPSFILVDDDACSCDSWAFV